LNFSHASIKRPLPFVNFKHNGGISDLHHTPHFSRRVHLASRLTQTLGVIFVGYDEKTAGGVAPQFDRQTLQNRFERSGFLFRRRLRLAYMGSRSFHLLTLGVYNRPVVVPGIPTTFSN
jgi:hypothetical protein